jgi:hypothetical protein
MVSVLATGPNERGFKPGPDDGFSRSIKIRSTPSFRREVKPEAYVVRFCGMLKTLRSMIEMLRQLNSRTFLVNSLLHC